MGYGLVEGRLEIVQRAGVGLQAMVKVVKN